MLAAKAAVAVANFDNPFRWFDSSPKLIRLW
jgi:hypothetical protein